MSGRQSKVQTVAALHKMGTGLRDRFGQQRLTFNNTSMTVDEIVIEFTAYNDQIGTTARAQVAWKQQVRALDKQTARVKALLNALRSYLRGFYGVGNPTLAAFGINPRKPRKQTATTRAAAVEKRAATRAVRKTLGSRQKKAIRGAAK